jgi:hypothetical protein
MGSSGLYLTLMMGPVEAVPVPKPVIDALRSAEVTISATGRSGFQLHFTLANNSPLQTFFVLASSSPLPVFRVILLTTFGGLPEVLFDGVAQHIEMAPSAMSASSTITVSGEDLTAVMDLIDLSGLPYPGMGPDVRVLAILAKYAMFGVVPNVMPVIAPDIPIPVDKIPTQKGTDLAYIKQLAKENGYTFYLEPGPLPGTSQAYWGPQVKIGIPQPALNVNLDAWTNVERLTFKYQPQGAAMPIVSIQDQTTKVTLEIPIPGVNPLDPPLGAIVPPPQQFPQLDDTTKLSIPQALMRGFARASESADVVIGDGTLDVLRYGRTLKARSLVGVRGAGLAFDGLHYVDSVTHQIKPGQYKQSFTLKRNALVSNTPVVPSLPF